ncbi:MAG TPA: hypothetical protein VFB36_10655 [Nevskiaceae bacterium]|nr:hypothetical protein [Nevskiaceae bacterium]
MAAKSRWLAYALCCAFIAACGGNDDNNDTGAAPTSTQIAAQSTNQDTATSAIPFTVGDADTSVSALTVTASSSNTTLVPNANIVVGGSGASRTLTITPASGQTGTSTITYNVSDGTHTTTKTFVLTVAASTAKTFDTPADGAQIAATIANLFNQVSGTTPSAKAARNAKATFPCPGGGTFDSTSDDSTTFAGDGTFMFSDCENTDDSNTTTTLNGQFVLKCTDDAQTAQACNDNDEDITLGQANTPFSAHVVNSPGVDILGDFYNFLVSLTDNGDQQTDSLSLDGRLVVTDNSAANNCGSGDVTVETVDPLTVSQSDTSQITGGELNLTSPDGSEANVVFNQDGSQTVTVNGVGQTYTAAQLAEICSAGG